MCCSKWLPPVKGVRTLMPLPGEGLDARLAVPSTSTARRRAVAAAAAHPGPVPELSEAECDMDIDTLKKLKLGLRSSLWSRTPGRPSTPGPGSGPPPPPPPHPSDYSIAV